MNCQECRKHLHPYMDSELEVPGNLAILEHLNACAPCQEIFEAEEASLVHVRTALATDGAPAALVTSLPRLLQGEDRRERWRRTTGVLVPIGVAAAFLVYMLWNPPTGATGPRPHEHGQTLHFTVSHFLGLHETSGKGEGLISRRLLDERASFRRLEPEQARQVYRELLGQDAKLPASLMGDSLRAARADADPSLQGTPVQDLLLLEVDRSRQFGLYVLDRAEVDLADLHLLREEGVTENLRIERCRHCHVIAVTRDDKVFILVTRPGLEVEPMIEMMKRTF